MALKKSVSAFGTPEFETILLEELGESDFEANLLNSEEDFNAADPDSFQVSVNDFTDEKTHIEVEVFVGFDELQHTGCSDIQNRNPGTAIVIITISKDDGEFDYEVKSVEVEDDGGDYA